MDRFELWRTGGLRGANAFPRHTVEDLSALRSWGANLAAFGLNSVLDLEEPFALKADAFADIDTAVGRAEQAGVFAALNYRSAPGRKEFNTDLAQFTDFKYHDAFVRMWRETARHLRGRKIVVGYDLMCEPHPEDLFSGREASPAVFATKVKGTPADWNLLVRRTVEAIREEDADTPIIVNSTGWAYAHTFDYLDLVADARTVYSVHFYAPHYYTHQKPPDKRAYPGFVDPDEPARGGPYDKAVIEDKLGPVRRYQQEHNVPIFSGEFGCARYAPGAVQWFRDQMDLYDEWGWSSAYWDLRGWEVMDIEMTADPADKNRYPDTPLLRVFRSYFAGDTVFPGGA
jgi:hypothetical protein